MEYAYLFLSVEDLDTFSFEDLTMGFGCLEYIVGGFKTEVSEQSKLDNPILCQEDYVVTNQRY